MWFKKHEGFDPVLSVRVQLARPILTPKDAAALLLMKRMIQQESPQCIESQLAGMLGENLLEFSSRATVAHFGELVARIRNATVLGPSKSGFKKIKKKVCPCRHLTADHR